jgi:hypothetical protein
LGNETAEKQAPSALTLYGEFKFALENIRHSDPSKARTPLKDLLNFAIAQYKRTITNKKFRIETGKKKMILNLMRCPDKFSERLSWHYDLHRHSASGPLVLVVVGRNSCDAVVLLSCFFLL